MKLYGLKNCDTCRAALKALRGSGQVVEFVDVREAPLSADLVARLVAGHGDKAVNRRSKTWAGLDESERALPPGEVIARHPVVMKRPLIENGDRLYLGWTDAVRTSLMP